MSRRLHSTEPTVSLRLRARLQAALYFLYAKVCTNSQEKTRIILLFEVNRPHLLKSRSRYRSHARRTPSPLSARSKNVSVCTPPIEAGGTICPDAPEELSAQQATRDGSTPGFSTNHEYHSSVSRACPAASGSYTRTTPESVDAVRCGDMS